MSHVTPLYRASVVVLVEHSTGPGPFMLGQIRTFSSMAKAHEWMMRREPALDATYSIQTQVVDAGLEGECGCTATTTCEACELEAEEAVALAERILPMDPFFDYERRSKPLD